MLKEVLYAKQEAASNVILQVRVLTHSKYKVGIGRNFEIGSTSSSTNPKAKYVYKVHVPPSRTKATSVVKDFLLQEFRGHFVLDQMTVGDNHNT